MKNFYFQENEKYRFYQQQLLDGSRPLKKLLCFVVSVILLSETLQTKVFLPPELTYQHETTGIITLVLFGIALVLYYISMFSLFEKRQRKIFAIRFIFLVLVVVLFSIAQALKTHEEIIDRVESNNIEKWYYSLIKARNEGWVMLLIDIIIPVWYLKLLVPLCYWIVQVFTYYQTGLQYKGIVWICCILSIIVTGTLFLIKSNHVWKIFKSQVNAETWDDVNKCLLDKITDAISIIDENSKIVYSNLSFRTICQDNLKTLSKKLSRIRVVENNLSAEKKEESENIKEIYTAHNFQEDSEILISFSHFIESVILPMARTMMKPDTYINFTAKMIDEHTTLEQPRWYQIKIGRLFESHQIILILSDITQRETAASLEKANQYKDKLLATVSHDLRAPINGTLTFIENSIQHEDVPETVKEKYLIPAQKSCKFILHLANDILDFAQINAQKLRMHFESCSLLETIKSCYQLLEMQATIKNIGFELVLDDKLPEKFTTDHTRLSQIIINLLTNAIKFTSKGKVTLSAKLLEESSSSLSSIVEINVTDTGIGIKDKDKDKMFQEFLKIEYEQRNINTQGVGLGLVIANKLAKRLDPNRQGINVSSVYGKGSSFRFRIEDRRLEDEASLLKTKNAVSTEFLNLSGKEEDFSNRRIDEAESINTRSLPNSPYSRDTSARHPFLRSPREYSVLSSFGNTPKRERFYGRVLIVEDNPINILALGSTLNRFGVATDVAYNGKEAIEKVLLTEEPLNRQIRLSERDELRDTGESMAGYHLIFMDYEMPVMNGLETARKLTILMDRGKISAIPIIGCTGHHDAEKIEECYANGMVNVISKPPQQDQLLEVLRKYMGKV